jgi:hypothetical protein
MIIGFRYVPSVEMYLIAVMFVRLTTASWYFLRSLELTNTLSEFRTLNRTPVSSIL